MTDAPHDDDVTDLGEHLARLAANPDPVVRAREANELIDDLDRMATMARKVRRTGIAELLAAGKGPTEVARAVGMSVSSVKIVQQQQNI